MTVAQGNRRINAAWTGQRVPMDITVTFIGDDTTLSRQAA
jgi:hypothetical protein